MTEQEYNEINAIRRSALHNLRKSPAHYKWCLEHPQKDTPALLMGRAVHTAVLQPELFLQQYACEPCVDKRTKAGKETLQQFYAENEGKEFLTPDDFNKCLDIHDAVMKNSLAADLLKGEHETSHVWTDDMTGLKCKIRTDAELQIGDTRFIIDLKTTQDASNEGFAREMIRYEYDLQAAMYTEGVIKDLGDMDTKFVFIAVEKEEPYVCNVLTASPAVMMRGYDIFRERIGIVAECERTGNWYGYNGFSGLFNDLELPGYLAKEYEQ